MVVIRRGIKRQNLPHNQPFLSSQWMVVRGVGDIDVGAMVKPLSKAVRLDSQRFGVLW